MRVFKLFDYKCLDVFLSIIFVVFISLVSVSFVRDVIGRDTSVYLEFYNSLPNFSYSKDFEPGFVLLSNILKLMNFNDASYIFACTLLGLILFLVASYKISPIPGFTLCVFVLSYVVAIYFGQLRQGISISLFFIAYSCYVSKRMALVFFFSVLSISFHFSSIFAIALLFFIRFVPLYFCLVFAIACAVFIFVDATVILKFLSQLPFIPDFASAKIHNYLTNEKWNQKLGFSPIHIVYLINVFVFMYYSRVVRFNNDYMMYKLYALGVAVNFIVNSAPVLIRLSYPLLVFEFFIFANLISKTRHRTNLTFLFAGYLLYNVFRLYLQVNSRL